nr:FAD-dependent oxidoreductase [Roseobacter litoralis]
MRDDTFDTIVIGAGSAGLAFARTAADLGARVLLIERDALGGTCVNRGCVPKKILWAAGRTARSIAQAADQGIAQSSSINFPALIRKRDAHIADIRASFADQLTEKGVTVRRGEATVCNANTVVVGDETYHAQHLVLATGGRPARIEIEGAEHLQNSDDVLSWEARPEHLAIIGGGYIGCEFAAIFRALGSEVTLIHNGPNILDKFPKDLALHAQSGLRETGISIQTNDSVTAIKKDDTLKYFCKSGRMGTADVVVAASGRSPNIDQLGEFVKALKTAESGALAISDQFQTSCAGVYAIGDVADRLPLTPVATADGTTLAHMLHGQGATVANLDLVATTAFVYPPAAFVGSTNNTKGKSGTVTPLAQNVLGQSSHDPDFYQLSVDEKNKTLTGAAIAAEGAEDIIAMASALIAAKASADAFTDATPVHPSFAEEFFSNTQTQE